MGVDSVLGRRTVDIMTRLGLWNILCVLPDETVDHRHRDWTEDAMEQPRTSHDSRDLGSWTDVRNVKASAAGGVFEVAGG